MAKKRTATQSSGDDANSGEEKRTRTFPDCSFEYVQPDGSYVAVPLVLTNKESATKVRDFLNTQTIDGYEGGAFRFAIKRYS